MSQAIGLANIAKLKAFFKKRDEEGDWEDYILSPGYTLNKVTVAEDSGLASRKTLTGGKAITKVYNDKVNELIAQGILEEDTRSSENKATSKTIAKIDASKLKRANKIAETNAALEEELFQERKKNATLEDKLQLLKKIEAYMEQTGRW
ncbi:hypothetical protein AADZ91_14805 [Colwelliaceae bacterium 6441]